MAKGKLILAYSGGLDTSVILYWLIAKGYEVVAFTADLGQEDDFDAVRERRLSSSLYDQTQSSMDVAGGYNPKDAIGFIKVNAIRLINNALRQQRMKQ